MKVDYTEEDRIALLRSGNPVLSVLAVRLESIDSSDPETDDEVSSWGNYVISRFMSILITGVFRPNESLREFASWIKESNLTPEQAKKIGEATKFTAEHKELLHKISVGDTTLAKLLWVAHLALTRVEDSDFMVNVCLMCATKSTRPIIYTNQLRVGKFFAENMKEANDSGLLEKFCGIEGADENVKKKIKGYLDESDSILRNEQD